MKLSDWARQNTELDCKTAYCLHRSGRFPRPVVVNDRDLNAAINLANYYHYYGTASSAGRACQMQEVKSARTGACR